MSVVLLAGCSKEAKQEDGAADVKVSFEELFRITSIDDAVDDPAGEIIWPNHLDVDSKGNIFILDRPTASIKKFDSRGRFIKSFGKKGDGPGEMQSPYMVLILDDILHVGDPRVRRIVKFDTDGNFITNVSVNNALPVQVQAISKDRFIGFLMSFRQEDNVPYRRYDLCLVDAQFNKLAVLSEYEGKFDPNRNDVLDRTGSYAVGKDKIYVPELTREHYKINIFDLDGKPLGSISREYGKVRFTPEELADLNAGLESFYKKLGYALYPPIKREYKNIINDIFCDKYGRLLVAASVKRDDSNRFDFLVDVIDKDGVFLKKVKLDGFKGYDYVKLQEQKFFFKGDRLYHIDEMDAVVTVYNY
jgi:hypothetical protein